MWIVAIGWSYVVILMAATETSIVAGIMTFLIYCMIPLSILFYLTGSKRRRARRAAAAQTQMQTQIQTRQEHIPVTHAGAAAPKAKCAGNAGNDSACDGGGAADSGGDGGGGGGGGD